MPFWSIQLSYMTLERKSLKRNNLVAAIEAQPGMSVYALSKHCQRPYRRVHASVQALVAAGQLRIEASVHRNRKQSLVYPVDICAQRLARLDDLYESARALGLRPTNLATAQGWPADLHE